MKVDGRKHKSKDNIRRMSQTKLENQRLQLIELIDKCDITQTENKLAIPSHRKDKYITFDKYKNMIKNGKNCKEMNKITSKHLVNFYNSILKGKITISKKQFEKEYNNATSLDEISKKYKMSREHVSFLRDFFGIKRKGATYIHRVKNEKPLSDKAKEIIIGSLLGDGGVTRSGCFYENHCAAQIKYLEWKADILKKHLNPKSTRCSKGPDKRSGTMIYSFGFYTKTHTVTQQLRKDFYPNNGAKIIPEYVYENLTLLQLAILFMDDGSTDWRFRGQNPKISPHCKISSQSFTVDENNKLKETLKKKWGIDAKIRLRSNDPTKPYLYFNKDGAAQLIKTVSPLIMPEFLYKINRNEYIKHINTKIDREFLLDDYIMRHKLELLNPNIKRRVQRWS